MRKTAPLMLLVVLVAALVGCDTEIDKPTKSEAMTLQANLFTSALRIDGAKSVPVQRTNELDGVQPGGIMPASLSGRLAMVLGGPIRLEVRVQPEKIHAVSNVVLRLLYASTELHLAPTFNDEGLMVIEGELLESPGLVGVLGRLQVILDNELGLPGYPLLAPIAVPDPRSPAYSDDITVLGAHPAGVTATAFSSTPGTSLLATGGKDGVIGLWDVEQVQRLAELEGHSGAVTALFVTESESRLYSASRDFTVRAWSVEEKRVLHTYGEHTNIVTSLAVNKDETILATGSWDHKVRFFRAIDGALTRELDMGDRVNALTMSPRGDVIAAGIGRLLHDGEVRVISVGDGEELGRFRELDGEVTALTFSADGTLLAAASGSGHIQVWRRLGMESKYEPHVELYGGPTDRIAGILFQSEQDKLLTISRSGFVDLWDLPSGERVLRVTTGLPMNCSAFQLSAKMVAIGTAVGTIPLITIDKAIAASGQFSAGNPGTK